MEMVHRVTMALSSQTFYEGFFIPCNVFFLSSVFQVSDLTTNVIGSSMLDKCDTESKSH